MKFTSIFRQHNIGWQWGAVKHAMGQISSYITAINLVLLSITAYSTGWIQEHIINLNFYQFAGILVLVIACLLLFAFKVDMPSYYSAWNQQMWKHDNPMRRVIEKQGRDIEAIKKHLGIED